MGIKGGRGNCQGMWVKKGMGGKWGEWGGMGWNGGDRGKGIGGRRGIEEGPGGDCAGHGQ